MELSNKEIQTLTSVLYGREDELNGEIQELRNLSKKEGFDEKLFKQLNKEYTEVSALRIKFAELYEE